jgi:hypothetical protein
MGAVARAQGLDRWAVWGPDNLLHIREIKKMIPEALIIHMIRDGRDVAVSMNKEKWIRPFPWDRHRGLVVAGLHWQWKVESGRRSGRLVEQDYMEVRFEELVADPRNVVKRVSEFIDQPIDFEFVQKHSVGTLKDPNSSFRDECENNALRPVERWKRVLSPSEVRSLESAIGKTLQELGYTIDESNCGARTLRIQLMRRAYFAYFGAKHWLKTRTFLGRFVGVDRLHLTG